MPALELLLQQFRELGQIEVLPVPILTLEDVANAPDRAAAEHADALLVAGSPLFADHQQVFSERAIALHLPTMHNYGFEAKQGELAAYGSDTAQNWMRAAQYVDRVLRGASIGELPFELPLRFIFTLNLGTARKLGLAIPPTLIATADEVIE